MNIWTENTHKFYVCSTCGGTFYSAHYCTGKLENRPWGDLRIVPNVLPPWERRTKENIIAEIEKLVKELKENHDDN